MLTDAQNASGGRYEGVAGDRIRVVGVGDRTHSLRVTGVGRNLEWSQMGVNGDFVVLYATPETAAQLAGQPGYSLLAFRLADASTAAANRTADDVREYLRANTSFTRFSDLPSIREPGHVPGQGPFRPARLADERVHGARAARGERAGREHDGDADRRAAP